VTSVTHIRLDSIRHDDLEFLRRLRNQERDWFFDRTEITTEAQQVWHANLAKNPDTHWYMVRADDAPAGCFSIKVSGDGRAELRCILLSPEFRGQGVMTRAIQRAMEELGHHLRYFAEILPNNEASLSLFSRLGFTTRFVTVERTAQ
jgi:RimJ/RimL family protein N-acetyltransferase